MDDLVSLLHQRSLGLDLYDLRIENRFYLS
jgi:hypothetical protein